MTSTSRPRSPCLLTQPCVSPKGAYPCPPSPARASQSAYKGHRRPSCTPRGATLPPSGYDAAYRYTEPSSPSRQHRQQNAYRGHRVITCDSLCDGLGSARECSTERSIGLGVAIGRQLYGMRIQPGIGSMDRLPASSLVSGF